MDMYGHVGRKRALEHMVQTWGLKSESVQNLSRYLHQQCNKPCLACVKLINFVLLLTLTSAWGR